MVWGGWVLLLENKVATASITQGQLDRYYRDTLRAMEDGSFLNLEETRGKRLCIIYLTPTEHTGTGEFKSLTLASHRKDVKVHLSWRSILDDLDHAFPENTADDPFGRLIRDARRLTADILKRRPQPKIKETDHRTDIKDFVKKVRARIETLMQFQPDLKLTGWRDVRIDQLYGHSGGEQGNVYFDIRAGDSTRLTNEDDSIVDGRMSFKIADRAKGVGRKELLSVPVGDWARILGLGADSVTLDKSKCWVIYDHSWSGNAADLVEQIASLFCRFLLIFRPFMAGQWSATNGPL
jgi:hypothetical protein